jgi:ATP-dependent helicase/nuclease subunit B
VSTLSDRGLCVSSRAELRLAHADDFLRELPVRGAALLLVPNAAAGTQLLARVLRPGEARFGWRRRTLGALARELALPELARERRVPLSSLAVEALVTRVVHELAHGRGLGRYLPLAERPGFVRALAKTLDELRLARVEPEQLALHAPELAAVLSAYRAALTSEALADRSHVLDAALRAAQTTGRAGTGQQAREVPLLALDVPLLHAAEALLAEALCSGRERAHATVVRGDERSEVHWHAALGERASVLRREPSAGPAHAAPSAATEPDDSELARLQTQLFSPSSVRRARASAGRGSVHIVSSPGEAREAVEVARGLAEAAASGVPFDRMAVVLRAAESYRAVVEEALLRADIPAHFADGVRRPLPDGRAFLALLACARDQLSAAAFAEYLSLGAMPRVDGEDPPVTPRQWERMLVEAAVIGGGRARWTRRIAGLRRELGDQRDALEHDDPRRALLDKDHAALASLEQFARPILDALAALPESGTWGAWIAALGDLARLSLRAPERVLEVLSELLPLSPIGPVTLRSVLRVLSQRLTSVVQPSAGHGAGKVFVAAIDDVRGRSFERVFVVGLAERVFPQRISEDTLLSDAIRRELGPELWLTEERVARERLLLRIAVGAASERLVLSFPRFDLAHGRPRVPSFYGLEVLQAIDGTLPAFDELTRRADPGAAARMGFPAPADAGRAIDDAEYDLAMLDRLMRAPEGSTERKGAARYLLEANAHLARALRFRARRWELARFSAADGFVASDDAGRALLAPHRLGARSYSATALAQFSLCPYKFYLHAIVGVAERPEAAAVDELDARQRGVLFHRVQRAVLSELARAGALPLTSGGLRSAQQLLERTFRALAEAARDEYAPSIDGVFETGLVAIARDLREWLTRLSSEHVFVPLHFELGFGLALGGELDPRRRELDPGSTTEPVRLPAGLSLTGAIDLVESSLAHGGDAHPQLLRATDYKTSAVPDKLGLVSGGRVLQPLLYALALEQLFPQAKVASGRLYFCTSRGEYTSHEVALDGAGRALIADLVGSIDTMIEQGFLPAAPAPQPDDRERSECERCAYRPVCGPYEAERVGQVKSRELARLAPLYKVRNLP